MDHIGIAIGVHYRDHRQLQLVGFGHRDVFLLGVEHKHRVGWPGQVSDAVEIAFQLRQFPGDEKGLFLGHDVKFARTAHPLKFLHLAHALGDGLEICEETT